MCRFAAALPFTRRAGFFDRRVDDARRVVLRFAGRFRDVAFFLVRRRVVGESNALTAGVCAEKPATPPGGIKGIRTAIRFSLVFQESLSAI